MGQTSILYRIDKDDFAKIIDNPLNFGLSKLTNGYAIFDKSFEGLKFVLSKGLLQDEVTLIENIFYPSTYVGERIDWDKIDFENLPSDFDGEDKCVSYLDPSNVREIDYLLSRITYEKFQSNFDYKELNQNDIYPSGIWNNSFEENVAFNLKHMLEEFTNLKTLFKNANQNGDYVLSYIE